MRYLVTGTAGFIGYHVAERLLARGDEVIGLDNVNDYYDVRLKHARMARLDGQARDTTSSSSTSPTGRGWSGSLRSGNPRS